MTEQFFLKVNPNKVSKAVKQFVENIAKSEGSKKKIDTDNEFNQLSMYLSGCGQSMNNDEIGYVQDFMIEYQNKKADEFEENCVTKNTKKEVNHIAKRMGNKKKIDTDEEAQALATMLKNTHNDLNTADIIYIQNLLINSGYANYLPKPEEPKVNVVNVTINEIYVDENNKTNEGKTTEIKKKQDDQPKYLKPRKRTRPYNPVIPQKPEKNEVPQKQEEKTKPTIAEDDRNKGFGLADRIVHELNSHIASNNEVKQALSEVNSKNAYSFVGKFLSAARQGVNEGVFSISDLFNRITYNDTLHVMTSLLKQAADIGLNDKSSYKELENEIKYAERLLSEKPNADPTDKTIEKADRAIEHLYKEMSKIYE